MILDKPETRILSGMHYWAAAQTLMQNEYLVVGPQDLAPAHANKCRVLLREGTDVGLVAQHIRQAWSVELEDDSIVVYGPPPADWQ